MSAAEARRTDTHPRETRTQLIVAKKRKQGVETVHSSHIRVRMAVAVDEFFNSKLLYKDSRFI